MADALFMEKKHFIGNKVQKLGLEEKVAKSKAKVRMLEKLEGSSSYGRNKMR